MNDSECELNLEDGEQCDGERIEVCGGRFFTLEIKLPTEKLHSEQREDEDEQEKKEQQRDDRAHGVEQRNDEVAQ